MQYDEGENSSHFKEFLNKRWVKVVLIIDVLIVLAIIGVLIWNATKTATVNFSIAPIDAKITLNGQDDYKNGTYKLHPGNYEVTVSRDGLESKTFDLELKSGYVTSLAAFLIGENNNFEFYELKDNYASFQKLSEIASAGNNQTTDQDTSAEGFIAKLTEKIAELQSFTTIHHSKYKLDPDSPSGESMELDITIRNGSQSGQCKTSTCFEALMVLTDDKTLVKNLLQEKGIEADDYEIIYKIY